MQRTYEVMFIVRPDMPEEEVEKLISTLESQVSSTGGTVKNVERMGKRRLAYIVRKFFEGMYILLTVEGGGQVVRELERRLRVTEPVIKFITVRVDEEQKRHAKIKALRDARRKAYWRTSWRRTRRWAQVLPAEKVCKFCVEKIDTVNYKDVRLLAQFVAESGKIVPRRLTGVCTPHQRRLSTAIKQARNIALLPFAGRA